MGAGRALVMLSLPVLPFLLPPLQELDGLLERINWLFRGSDHIASPPGVLCYFQLLVGSFFIQQISKFLIVNLQVADF